MSVKFGCYEQFYQQQPLSENIHFQIYSSDEYFIDLTSTFIDLHVIVEKSKYEKPSVAEGLSYQNLFTS